MNTVNPQATYSGTISYPLDKLPADALKYIFDYMNQVYIPATYPGVQVSLSYNGTTATLTYSGCPIQPPASPP